MTPSPVLLDACVLLPYHLCDLLLRLADAELYRPLWSDQILAEVERNLTARFGQPADNAARRVGHMRRAFPWADVQGYQHLIPSMTNHPKDRHVLAAAVRGGAELLVTANLKDFPTSALSAYDIEAVHPDEFLLDHRDLHPTSTLHCLIGQRAAYSRPSLTSEQLYQRLRLVVPQFANRAEQLERDRTR